MRRAHRSSFAARKKSEMPATSQGKGRAGRGEEGSCAAAAAAAVGNGQWPNDAAPPVTVTLEF